MSTRSCWILAAFWLASCAGTPTRERSIGSTELSFAFWNVENLFDADDDPVNPGDDEYGPERGWTDARYRTKLDHLARVIGEVRPHFLGLCEIENRRVLEDLCAHPQLAEMDYRVAHRDSPDKRGIDLALIYRAPFELDEDRDARLHPIDRENTLPTRGVLEVQLRIGVHPLTVLVNHWPSRGGDRDGSFRAVAGDVVRGIVDRLGHDTDVLIVGDLNDDPFDPSVRAHLGAIRSRNAVVNRRDQDALYNPSWSLFGKADEGTLYYNREWVWNVFDQAIVSKGLLDSVGFRYVDGSLEVFAPDELRDGYRRPLRFRRGRDGSWEEGYSDHFLIHGRLLFDDGA